MLTKEEIQYIYSFKDFALYVCQDRTLSDDIMQDCFYNILTRSHSFSDIPEDERAYFVKRVIRNVYKDYIRKLDRRVKTDSIEDVINPQEYFYTPPSLQNGQGGYYSLQLEEINKLLGSIKGGKEYSLVLQGYKYKEVAKRLKMPIGTVLNHCHLAKNTIKAIYA